MERIVIFTATYNRAGFLKRAYDALRRQSCKDFYWMIIDDGSTDNTKEVVDTFIDMHPGFRIQYIYKENGGLYTCWNTAIKFADDKSEFLYSIDSDDWIADDAIEMILRCWDACEERDKYAGILGLAYLPNDSLIGKSFSEKTANMMDMKMQPIGDKPVIIRTDLMKQYAPMPEFKGEKDFDEFYLLWKISEKYNFLAVNECLLYKEYQSEGRSANLFLQYVKSPNSYMEVRRCFLEAEGIPLKWALRQAIHYVSSCIFAKRYLSIWTGTKRPFLCTICLLPGCVLNFYVRYRISSNKKNRILK